MLRDQLVDLGDALDGAGDERIRPRPVVLVDHDVRDGVGVLVLGRWRRVASRPVGADRFVRGHAADFPLIEHLQRGFPRAMPCRAVI